MDRIDFAAVQKYRTNFQRRGYRCNGGGPGATSIDMPPTARGEVGGGRTEYQTDWRHRLEPARTHPSPC
ncbi:hypothetical protein GWI33_000043 [Rhynchophorus ferrugineus]|uniref:Uncharacterized protein n=1 Tax=Rhynchophorus ferrugineus TaxID=354439 RepID=A0A834MLA9_RHYFE|nr:hypothetical protein GWI33_000043 [Rhynchophorus ferrugineus]